MTRIDIEAACLQNSMRSMKSYWLPATDTAISRPDPAGRTPPERLGGDSTSLSHWGTFGKQIRHDLFGWDCSREEAQILGLKKLLRPQGTLGLFISSNAPGLPGW